jgi:hypothetical protein
MEIFEAITNRSSIRPRRNRSYRWAPSRSLFRLQDTVAAVQNILLVAYPLGLAHVG